MSVCTRVIYPGHPLYCIDVILKINNKNGGFTQPDRVFRRIITMTVQHFSTYKTPETSLTDPGGDRIAGFISMEDAPGEECTENSSLYFVLSAAV